MKAAGLFFLTTFAFAAEGPFDKLTSNDLARGKKMFEAQCGLCHGINGGGGKAANLAVTRFRHAATDADLLELIRNGIPDTEMPAAWWMSDRESLQVAYYVRSLGRMASTIRVAGNIPMGEEVFFGKAGCGGCHIVKGRGGSLGPDLTEVGARRSPAHLRQAVASPAEALPAGFLMLTITDATGTKMRGIRLNEDTFTIQIKDLGGKLHSFRKSDITLAKETGKTPMPAYKHKLSENEFDNLIAYLASLRGEI